MSALVERQVSVNGHACRVWEKGEGPKVGYFAGLLGLPAWTPFLEQLSKTRRVIAPSLPGFPGATGHEDLDHLIDWVAAGLDLMDAAGLVGEDLIGACLGGLLAAEIAALSPRSVKRLALMAPLGLYDEATPVPHLWAKPAGELNASLCLDQPLLEALLTAPDDASPVEWNIERSRASAAASRLLWPMCDVGTVKRLHRISSPTLILWGDQDVLLPAKPYAGLFQRGIGRPARIEIVVGAGHLLDLDQPIAAARAVEAFLLQEQTVEFA